MGLMSGRGRKNAATGAGGAAARRALLRNVLGLLPLAGAYGCSTNDSATSSQAAKTAKAVVSIADGSEFRNVAALRRILRLEGNVTEVRWHLVAVSGSPIERWGQAISGDQTSPVQVAYLRWQKPNVWDRSRDAVTIVFRPGLCPSDQDFERAFGQKIVDNAFGTSHGPVWRTRGLVHAARGGAEVEVFFENCVVQLSVPA